MKANGFFLSLILLIFLIDLCHADCSYYEEWDQKTG